MTRSIRIAFTLIVFALAGCGKQPANEAAGTEIQPPAASAEPASSSPSAVEAQAPQAQPATEAKPAAKPGFENFSVEITMSPKAQAMLERGKETIMVAAYFYGTPNKAGEKEADEMGQLHLGNSDHELAQAGTIAFDGDGFESDRMNLIQGEPQVNINVYSGRHSSENNLIDCDFFEDAVSMAASKPIQLHCKLIGEP